MDPCLCPPISKPEQPNSTSAVGGCWMDRSTSKQALLCQGAKGPITTAHLLPPIANSETSPSNAVVEPWEGKAASKNISAPGDSGCFLPHSRREGSSPAAPGSSDGGGGSFCGRPLDDLSLVPARLEAPQGSSQLDGYINTFFTIEMWRLWAGAALGNDTELTGTNEERGLLLISVGGGKDQC